MKSLVLTFFLCLTVPFYGQTKDSLEIAEGLNLNLYDPGFSNKEQPNLLQNFNTTSQTSNLVLYNGTTNLYDVYSASGEGYTYSSSTTQFRPKSNFFTTLFLGNDSFTENKTLLRNRSLLLDEDDSYRVRDSFNPHGASNFSEAIIGGVLGLLFD